MSDETPKVELSERDALLQARDEGIKFRDEFVLVHKDPITTDPEKGTFKTRAEAEAALRELGDDNYHIEQRRHRRQ